MKKAREAQAIDLKIPLMTIRQFYFFNDEISEQFTKLYFNFFRLGISEINDEFTKKSKELFSAFTLKHKTGLSDCYFNNFTPVTEELLKRGQHRPAFNLWLKVIGFVREWEKAHKRKLHKGTPYYFASVAAALCRDYDSSAILMHLAIKEDKDNHPDYTKCAGYSFLTLNDQQDSQYFKPFVDGMAGFVRDRLDGNGNEQGKYKKHYQSINGNSLSHTKYREKFLDNKGVPDEAKFLFAYSVMRLWNLRTLQKSRVGDDMVAPLMFYQALSGIFIVTESLLTTVYPECDTLGALIKELFKAEQWSEPDLKAARADRKNNLSKWIKDTINNQGLESDFLLLYGLRNLSFHSLETDADLWKYFTVIIQSIFNCLFKSIEVLSK